MLFEPFGAELNSNMPALQVRDHTNLCKRVLLLQRAFLKHEVECRSVWYRTDCLLDIWSAAPMSSIWRLGTWRCGIRPHTRGSSKWATRFRASKRGTPLNSQHGRSRPLWMVGFQLISFEPILKDVPSLDIYAKERDAGREWTHDLIEDFPPGFRPDSFAAMSYPCFSMLPMCLPKPWFRLTQFGWQSLGKQERLCGCGSKFNSWGYAGFGLPFHLPWFHFGPLFLSHTHINPHCFNGGLNPSGFPTSLWT